MKHFKGQSVVQILVASDPTNILLVIWKQNLLLSYFICLFLLFSPFCLHFFIIPSILSLVVENASKKQANKQKFQPDLK